MRGERLDVAAEVLGVVMGQARMSSTRDQLSFLLLVLPQLVGWEVVTDAMLLGGGREPKTEEVAGPAIGAGVHCQSSAHDAYTCD